MKKLEKQVKSADVLGVTRHGGAIAYDAKVDGQASITVPLAVNSVIPTLRCWLNGSTKPTVLMFDSGAQVSLIDADTAVKSNVGILDPSTTNITVMGVMGKEKMLAGLFAPLDFGQQTKLTKQLCLVRTNQNETRWMGPLMKEKVSMDLLGFDMVRQWCRYLTVDYRAHKMTFGFKEDFKRPTGSMVWKMPLIMEGGMPNVVLESKGIRWLSLVDTGSAFGVEIDESLAAELDVLRTAKPVEPGMVNTAIGGMSDVNKAGIKLAMLKKLDGLGPEHQNAEIAISPGGARVGSFFFKDYRLTMDLKRQLLWLER